MQNVFTSSTFTKLKVYSYLCFLKKWKQMHFLNSWYNCIFEGHCSLKISSSFPRHSFYRTNVLNHWFVRGATQNKRNSKCLLRAVANKENQLHFRYKCVYHNLMCLLHLNDTLSTKKLQSFEEWEWRVTNLRIKLLRPVLWHVLRICLLNITESQNMGLLRLKFESKIYQIRIKLSSQYTLFAVITIFIFKFKKGKNILRHFYLYNKKYFWYIGL
jgi:hypothetical protein